MFRLVCFSLILIVFSHPLLAKNKSVNICAQAFNNLYEQISDFPIRRENFGKPTYVHERFDVRILQLGSLSKFITRKVALEKTVSQVQTSIEKLDEFGFPIRHYIHVLVALTRHTISFEGYKDAYTRELEASYFPTRSSGIIYFPGVFKKRSIRPHSNAGIVALTPLGARHVLWEPNIASHELAHASEVLTNRNTSLIWLEARADFLAYLITGRPQLTLDPNQVIHNFQNVWV